MASIKASVSFSLFEGQRLKPEIRKNLLVFKRKINSRSLRAKVDSFLIKNLKDVLDGQVYAGQILPTFWANIDFIFCAQIKENKIKAVKIPQDYIQKLESRMEIAKPPIIGHDFQWYCIVIVKRRAHLNASGQVIGPMQLKVELLEKLGFKVITLDLETIHTKLRYHSFSQKDLLNMLFFEK